MIRFLAAGLLCLMLSACALVDSEQDSLCRRIIPALLETPKGVRVLQSSPVGESAIAVRLWLAADGRDHRIVCAFAGNGLSPNKRLLERVSVDGRPIGPAALFYIITRWLGVQDSVVAEPPPARGDRD